MPDQSLPLRVLWRTVRSNRVQHHGAVLDLQAATWRKRTGTDIARPTSVAVRLGDMTRIDAAPSQRRSKFGSRARPYAVSATASMTIPMMQPAVVSMNSAQVNPLVTSSIEGE